MVERISSTQEEGSRRQYLVRWGGGDMTWEPEKMLTHVPELLKQFLDANALPCRVHILSGA